jgi:hypothetical protein
MNRILLCCLLCYSACTSNLRFAQHDDAGPSATADGLVQPPLGFGTSTASQEFPFETPRPIAGEVRSPAIDCGPSECLVAWYNTQALLVSRVDSAGKLRDPEGIQIAPTELLPNAHHGPFVVADQSGGFHVVWGSTRQPDPFTPGLAQRGGCLIHVVHVDTKGQPSTVQLPSGCGTHLSDMQVIKDPTTIDQALILQEDATTGQIAIARYRYYKTSWRYAKTLPAIAAPGLRARSSQLAMLDARVLVSWAAEGPEGGRLELRDLDRGRTLSFKAGLAAPRVAHMRDHLTAMAVAGKTVAVGWLDDKGPLLVRRFDANLWQWIDAAPIEVAPQDRVVDGVGPLLIADHSSVFVTVGATDTAGWWLDSTGSATLKPVDWSDDSPQAIAAASRFNNKLVAVQFDPKSHKPSTLSADHASVYRARLVSLPWHSSALDKPDRLFGGGKSEQVDPSIVCNTTGVCLALWTDHDEQGASTRVVRIDGLTGKRLGDPLVVPATGYANPVVASLGADFILLDPARAESKPSGGCKHSALLHSWLIKQDGAVEARRTITLPCRFDASVDANRPGFADAWTPSKVVVAAAQDRYLVAFEQQNNLAAPAENALYFLELRPDGRLARDPIDLGAGGQVALVATTAGAVVVYRPARGQKYQSRLIANGRLSDPQPLEAIDPPQRRWFGSSSHGDPRAYPQMVASASDANTLPKEVWVSWIREHGARWQIVGLRLDARGKAIGELQRWIETDQIIESMRVQRDAFSPVVGYVTKKLQISARSLWLRRVGSTQPETPFLVAEETLETIGLCSLGPGRFVMAYLRDGPLYGIQGPVQKPARAVGRLVQLASDAGPK